MDARTIDDADLRLRELRHEEWGDFGLAALAFSLALLATRLAPTLALPIFVGAVVVAARGVRAAWLRWDIVDRLAGERDAYVIAEIREHALRDSTLERRRLFAAYIRADLEEPLPHRLAGVANDLEELAAELEDESLTLDAACAVACARLVHDPHRGPLLHSAGTAEDLRSRVRQIRSGFAPRATA
jgi:hypothetical protein